MPPFHYAFKVADIQSTRRCYVETLGCKEGRSTDRWIDFDFFGHQLPAHLSADQPKPDYCGLVDGVGVPIPHFGCLLSTDWFEAVRQQLVGAAIEFIVEPQTRYAGQVGQQKTMFVLDPSGNALEFKSFEDEEEQFAG